MFLNKNITVIFITRTQIKSAVFSLEGKIKKEMKIYGWTKDSLSGVLRDIAARGPARTRVVFGEEFSYVMALPMQERKKENMLEQVQEKIPEYIATNWDFKKERSSETQLQVAAIQPEIMDIFETEFMKAGLNIESIEPQSVALARLLPEKGFHLFIAADEKILLGVINDGTVEIAYVALQEEIIDKVEKFLAYVRKKTAQEPQTIFVGGNINTEAEFFQKNNIPIKIMELDALRGTALKENISGEDEKVLNVRKQKTNSFNDENRLKKSGMSQREKWLLFIFVAFIAITIGVVFRYKF